MKLSGGQQQQVAIARALASNAKVLLANEPTGNLDEQTAVGIIELLKRTAHELGKCVIVVTHSKYLANEADEIVRITNGMIDSQKKYNLRFPPKGEGWFTAEDGKSGGNKRLPPDLHLRSSGVHSDGICLF